MSKPIISIHNAETGEVINREMTNEEFAVYEANANDSRSQLAEQEAKEAARKARLIELGLD
jgi:hypothetical protein